MPKGYGLIDTVAGLRTTEHMIPVESEPERQIAHLLVEQGRAFRKPLRFDSEAVTFPDFLLLDTDPVPLPLEVYGRVNDPTYEARKAAKNLYYRTLPGGCWCWDLTTDESPPPLPPRTS